MPARYQAVTDDEMLHEGEYDDIWPVRPHSSALRFHGPADVRSEAGRAADVQTQVGQRGSPRSTGEHHSIPPRRSATQARLPALPKTPPVRVSLDEDEQEDQPLRTRPAGVRRSLQLGHRRLPWLFFPVLALLVMVFGWVGLSAVGSWWQTTLDDWHYGRPRTYQTDIVVCHPDSMQNSSHFIAMNLNRHIIIIEIPGGDVSKSIVYSGPALLGPGQNLTPVTLSFQDVNHDGKLDMLVNVQGDIFVFLNQNGMFVPSTQNSNSTG